MGEVSVSEESCVLAAFGAGGGSFCQKEGESKI